MEITIEVEVGDKPYPGEVRDLVNSLVGERQLIGNTVGLNHPVFIQVDNALNAPVLNLSDLRASLSAAYELVDKAGLRDWAWKDK